MAGVVGTILTVAILVTAFSMSVRTDLPRWGAEAERAWDDQVALALVRLHERLASGEHVSLAAVLPAPPTARALDVPLLGRAAPAAASGSASFAPNCLSVNVTHVTPAGLAVKDIVSGATGCLEVRLDSAYEPAVRYRLESGGLLRIDGTDAVVLAGPRLSLVAASPSLHRVSVVVPSLTGPAGLAVLSTGADLEFAALPASAVIPATANAGSAEIRMATAYPKAWEGWWARTLRDAGFGSTSTISCHPASCSVGATGTGTVVVGFPGPLGSGGDIAFAAVFVPTSVRIG